MDRPLQKLLPLHLDTHSHIYTKCFVLISFICSTPPMCQILDSGETSGEQDRSKPYLVPHVLILAGSQAQKTFNMASSDKSSNEKPD